ncbi:lytic transglycosylase domain-containing protein [Nocardioides sp. W7]|uniref:aggregation-promoting factor C-terminal-like domain-containing protein n=1 Tax=Nocardioides sp. W7 TaxID=2931390 RepID=UPI001FD4FB6F|nr:lytic transglycosylase domain-containing protein [Nocardioides sp. W7]
MTADAPKKAIRTTLVMSSLAVAATGATVSAGLLGSAPASVTIAAADLGSTTVPHLASSGAGASAATDAGDAAETGAAASAAESAPAAEAPARTPVLSRSDRREAADPAKVAALSQDEGGAMSVTESLSDDNPRDIARALLGEFGFSGDQFSCLDSLWTRESNWTWNADNPSSSAYGIPQALPGSKMSSAGADWETNPATQIRWGLGYIDDRYGSPCGAWGHSQSHGWY